MRRARELILFLAALALSLAILPGPARAGDKDPDGLIAVAESMNDFVEGKSAAAIKKIEAALKVCAGAACEANTRAQLYVALAIVQGAGVKDSKKATAAFESAIREDANIKPDAQFMTAELKKLFAAAKANVKKGSGGASATRPPPSKQQMEQVSAAQAQLNQKDWSSCMGTAIAAMAETEFAAGKLILAQCEDAGGLLLEASADAKLALKYAEEEANPELKKKATDLSNRLDNDIPTILVQIPRSVDEPVLTIDGVVVPKEKADKPIQHNPGKATIEVKGKKGSYPFTFKTTESFDRGERITVNAEAAGGQNSSAVFQCIQAARTPSDVALCIETGGKGRGLTLRGGLEIATYNDSVSVDVFSPTAYFSAENPTAGWRVGASYTVDVVTNASPDIIATATRRFDEVRNAGSLAVEVKIGPTRVGIDGAVSIERDYMGRSVGASVSADLKEKMLTPAIAYHLSFDLLGRSTTPYKVFSRNVFNHSIDAGLSMIANPSTILAFAATVEILDGDTSKPYRHIPMFTKATAGRIPRGATPALVNGQRLAPAPFEQLPDARQRFAIGARFARRFETSTLRLSERLYVDTWGLKASTTDARYFVDLSKKIRVGPHARFHIQGPVDFWERAYVAESTPQGWKLPKYRAGDRELGPLFGVTGGGGIRFAVNDVFAIALQAEGVYTQFLDTIYVYDRWALFTATTLEFGVE